jgi:hypothetical protein
MKYMTDRPGKGANRLLEHAHAIEPIQDGRIYIEKVNGPFLFDDKDTPAEYAAGLERAIALGCSNCMKAVTSSASRKPARTCLSDGVLSRTTDRPC